MAGWLALSSYNHTSRETFVFYHTTIFFICLTCNTSIFVFGFFTSKGFFLFLYSPLNLIFTTKAWLMRLTSIEMSISMQWLSSYWILLAPGSRYWFSGFSCRWIALLKEIILSNITKHALVYCNSAQSWIHVLIMCVVILERSRIFSANCFHGNKRAR